MILDFIINSESFTFNSSDEKVSASAMETDTTIVFSRLHKHLENLSLGKYLLQEGWMQGVFYSEL